MTTPKKHKTNWQQAMLNEAEAAENSQWAKETRRAALFQPVRDSFALWNKADGGTTYWINLPFLYILANKSLNYIYNLHQTKTSSSLLGSSLGLLTILFLSGILFGLFNRNNLILANIGYWSIYCILNLMFTYKNLPLIFSLEFIILTTLFLSIGYWLGYKTRLKLKI